jgi:hypothetical protein
MFVGRKPLTAIDRREILRALLGGTVVAAAGLVLIPDAAESAPLPLSPQDAVGVETPVEQTVVVTRRAGRRPRRHPARSAGTNMENGCAAPNITGSLFSRTTARSWAMDSRSDYRVNPAQGYARLLRGGVY